ncbi:MAG: hypothetical protein DMD76_28205 [Candidatus Rokuibacteriota bacterium]|nr:MAG: hypothetical protein DMD76_28205 [Candidatus Rokubacteria bacterium]
MAKDTDRFGNKFAPNLSYARGKILGATSDDFTKLQRAWGIIRERGPEAIYIFTGLDHSLPMEPEDLRWADDEIAPALHWDRLKALTLEHLGGTAPQHDIAVFNRLTGATLATHLTLVKPGDVVIGVSVSHSHPSVLRAAAHVGARFTDTAGLEEFKRALDREPKVALVDLTRLAVTYELLPVEAIRTIVRLAHDKGALVYVDDAGGARVGPASFDQPKTLELGVDVGATGLDKTLEKYSPKRVQELIDTTKAVAAALRPIFGDRLRETPTTAQLLADDVLAIAMERGGVNQAPIVPFEASAALCMLLLQDHSMLTVHFVGMPPGGADILFKFIPPETLARFGGPRKFASAVDGALTTLGSMLKDPASIRALLLGGK